MDGGGSGVEAQERKTLFDHCLIRLLLLHATRHAHAAFDTITTEYVRPLSMAFEGRSRQQHKYSNKNDSQND